MVGGKKKVDIWSVVSWLLMALFLLFLLYPLVNLLKESIYVDGGFSLDAFATFFSKSGYYDTLWASVKVGICTTIASIALGIPFAYFYTFYKIKGKKLLFILCLLCTMSAPFIGAYAWILLMGNNGFFTNLLGLIGIKGVSIYGFGGIVFVQTLKLFPLVVIYMNGAFSDIDNSLMEAAASMNCKGLNRFLKVIMTLTMPTILAAALLVFMRSFADFGTPALIGRGYSTFPVLIYQAYLGENGTNYNFAAAIGVIAVVVTAGIFIIQKIASSKFKFTINALHPIEPRAIKGVKSGVIHGFLYLLVGIALLPQFYIVNMSFRNYNNTILQPGYSLNNWTKALSKDLFGSLSNTMVISILALVIIIAIAVPIAYMNVRRSNLFNNLIDTFSMLPYILPGAVVGIALIVTFSGKPFSLSGSLTIMIIALVIRRMPFTSRSATAAMMKIPITTEEAALSLGASKLKAFIFVTAPQMSRGIIAGAILSWVSIITEMSSGVILYTNQNMTLTLSTYAMINTALYGVAAVFATVTMIFTVICLVIYLHFEDIETMRM